MKQNKTNKNKLSKTKQNKTLNSTKIESIKLSTTIKKSILLLFAIFFASIFAQNCLAIQNIMSLQGSAEQLGAKISSGNLSVTIFNAPTGGTQIYNSGSDFNGSIKNGRFDVVLGSGSNDLVLEYGQLYYMDLSINGIDLDFNGSERRIFQSAVGKVGAGFVLDDSINSSKITNGSILDFDISNSAAINKSKISSIGYWREAELPNITAAWNGTINATKLVSLDLLSIGNADTLDTFHATIFFANDSAIDARQKADNGTIATALSTKVSAFTCPTGQFMNSTNSCNAIVASTNVDQNITWLNGNVSVIFNQLTLLFLNDSTILGRENADNSTQGALINSLRIDLTTINTTVIGANLTAINANATATNANSTANSALNAVGAIQTNVSNEAIARGANDTNLLMLISNRALNFTCPAGQFMNGTSTCAAIASSSFDNQTSTLNASRLFDVAFLNENLLISIFNITAIGTPSASTYLRGDGTWSAVSAEAPTNIPSGNINYTLAEQQTFEENDFFRPLTAGLYDNWISAAVGTGGTVVIDIGGNLAKDAFHPGRANITSGTVTNSGWQTSAHVNSIRINGSECTTGIWRANADWGNNITTVRFGFTDSITATLPVDGIFFEETHNSTNAQVYARVRSNNLENNLSIMGYPSYSIAIGDYYKYKICVNSDASNVTFQVYNSTLGNTALLWTGHAGNKTSLPVAIGRETSHAFVVTSTAVTVSSKVTLDYINLNMRLLR